MKHCTDENTSQQTQLLEKNNTKINDKNLQKSINQSINIGWSRLISSKIIHTQYRERVYGQEEEESSEKEGEKSAQRGGKESADKLISESRKLSL